jgi:hypothetical protein
VQSICSHDTSIRIYKFFSHIKERTDNGSVHEQGAKGSIWNEEEVTDSRRKLHNEELHTMHSSPDIILLLEL